MFESWRKPKQVSKEEQERKAQDKKQNIVLGTAVGAMATVGAGVNAYTENEPELDMPKNAMPVAMGEMPSVEQSLEGLKVGVAYDETGAFKAPTVTIDTPAAPQAPTARDFREGEAGADHPHEPIELNEKPVVVTLEQPEPVVIELNEKKIIVKPEM